MPSQPILRLITLLFILLFGTVVNASYFEGEWQDNASGLKRIGNLSITDKTISIINVATYNVSLHRSDDSSAIYKVTGVNHKTDPFGCGPDSKVYYLIVLLLPDIPQNPQESIWLLFYGLPEVPDISTIKSNRAVCSVYSFGRDP